jgi:hypothetical protein
MTKISKRRRAAAKDNPQKASEAVARDLARLVQTIHQQGGEYIDDISHLPAGPRTLISFVYGTRDRLTKAAAKQSAKVWLKTIAQNPRSVFCLSIAGYDDDPRPLHEFEEVRRYVRQWAKFAGITSPDSIKVEVDSNIFFIGLLAVCDCTGFEHIKAQILAGGPIKPTTPQ